ncbi:translation initiation factor IF-2-like [Prionailurus viverrinus]|uniref:translation initiation factor IF-2-like n=1 Tax=Prionailurus viverrinus TaxID=61388 RepID=UPI001FF55555|nr:translation initiation factor IF-2-like [Prionailurus viverrinus]
MGARGSVAALGASAWLRSARRGSRLARPARASAGRWPRARGATPRVTRPAAAIGAGRPAGAGSPRRRPWARRLSPGSPGRRASCGPESSEVADAAPRTGGVERSPPPPERPRGPGSGGKGRGSRGFCSVTADASPSLPDRRDRRNASHLPSVLLCSPAPGRGCGLGEAVRNPVALEAETKKDKRRNKMMGRDVERKMQHRKKIYRKTEIGTATGNKEAKIHPL